MNSPIRRVFGEVQLLHCVIRRSNYDDGVFRYVIALSKFSFVQVRCAVTRRAHWSMRQPEQLVVGLAYHSKTIAVSNAATDAMPDLSIVCGVYPFTVFDVWFVIDQLMCFSPVHLTRLQPVIHARHPHVAATRILNCSMYKTSVSANAGE